MRWQWLVLLTIALLCLCAPLLTQADPTQTNTEQFLQAPSSSHLLGTDHLGRDIWARWLWGGQRTLGWGGAAALLAIGGAILLTGGTLLLPRFLQQTMKWVASSLVTLPPLIMGLLVLLVVGRGAGQIVIAAALAQIPTLMIVLLGRAHQSQTRDYVLAARSIGASELHILRVHIRRSLQATLLALGVLNLAYVLGMIATLSFLGLGDEAGAPEWGVMIAEGRYSFLNALWVPLAPGISLTLVIGAISSLAKHYERSLGD
jgi:peptide/nickel transport system permease protein